MDKNELLVFQIKQNVLQHLKNINLSKKDKSFLLELIKLFDLLTENPKETFINSLIELINNVDSINKEELNIRLNSLNIQLEQNKFSEIRHFSHFSMYIEKEKINIYIKKISLTWDLLISEIEKINFLKIRVIVYKLNSKKEKIFNKVLKNDCNWKKELLTIIENNICINIQITLELEKQPLN